MLLQCLNICSSFSSKSIQIRLKIKDTLIFNRVDAVRGTTFILLITGGTEMCSALKVPRQCPIALVIKIGWKQRKELGNKEDSVLGVGCQQCVAEEEAEHLR
jgi:hypothetical protein